MCARSTGLPNRLLSGRPAALAGVAAALLLLAGAGCSELDVRKGFLWPDPEPEPQTPTRMIDIWTDTVLWQPGKPGVRGFGGRIMFYRDDEEQADPITVDGTLTVYAFDDEDPDPDKPPVKKFIFPADQLPKHYSESKVGHSYSFWLPWGDVRGPEQQISLITRFEGREGKVVMSKVAHKLLPGRKSNPDAPESSYAQTPGALDAQAAGAVRQVAHQTPVQTPAGQGERRQMSTLTIDVTPSFAQKLRAAHNAPGDARGESVRLPTTAESRAEPPARSKEGLPQSIPEDPRPADSRPSRFPAPRGAEAGQAYGLFPRPLRRSRWPSPLPWTPRPSRSPLASETTGGDESAPY